MRSKVNSALSSVFLACVAVVFAAKAADSAQVTWKPQEIRYSYTGFTTAYSCEGAEDKLERILKTLGAHPNTKVRATGCPPSRPSKDFFVTVTTATPVPVTAGKTEDRPDGKVLRDLRLDEAALTKSFAAERKTVDLSKDRELNLQPGDCELLEGLRDHVLPKLGLEIVEDRVSCTPHQLSIQTPTLKVAAWLPLKTADQT
jgi:hypothetical protein